MLDIFGLHKDVKPEEPAPAPAAARGSQRLWAVLLLLDTVLVFGFGGALAGLLWMHRPKTSTPPPTPSTTTAKISKALPKATAAPEPVVHKPETAPVKAASAAPAASKEPAPASKQEAPSKNPVGSPTVSAPDLPQRQTAPVSAPGEPAKSSVSSPAGAKPKAVPTEFVCRSASARDVRLKGPFLVRTGGVKPMLRGDDGAWRITVSLLPGTYKYYCIVDGKRSKIHSITVP